MISSPRYLDEIVDFITSGPSPDEIIAFRPSQTAQDYLSLLLEKKQAESLTDEEQSELDYYLFIEHLLRMSKIKATQKMAA